MNNLFDKLNAIQLNDKSKFKNVYSGTDEEKAFLNEVLDTISKIKLIDQTHPEMEKCFAVYGKNENIKEAFERNFCEHKNTNLDEPEQATFIKELNLFISEIKILRNNKTKTNITKDVVLYYGNDTLQDSIKSFFESIKTTENYELFDNIASLYNSIKICRDDKNVTARVSFLDGWFTTIKATMIMFENLKAQHNFKYLITRRINQNALEIFFGQIRRRNGNCTHPNCSQFATSFNQVSLMSLMEQETVNFS